MKKLASGSILENRRRSGKGGRVPDIRGARNPGPPDFERAGEILLRDLAPTLATQVSMCPAMKCLSRPRLGPRQDLLTAAPDLGHASFVGQSALDELEVGLVGCGIGRAGRVSLSSSPSFRGCGGRVAGILRREIGHVSDSITKVDRSNAEPHRMSAHRARGDHVNRWRYPGSPS